MMPMWNRYERVAVTEMRDGCVYRTKIVGSEWFEVGKGPKMYELVDGHMWVVTSDYLTQKDKPTN